MSLFSELKRRNVFRVGIAYMVMSWLLVQVLGLAADSFEAPTWVMKMFITGLLIGFLPTMLFSWAYELTPDGLKKDSEIDKTTSDTSNTAKKLDIVTLIAVLAVIGLFAYQQFSPVSQNNITNKTQFQTPQTQAEVAELDSRLRGNNKVVKNAKSVEEKIIKDDKSIAVLPFVDLSPAKDQEYFTDGLTENLLHALAQIREIKVAGRTSSFAFKNKNIDLREIGQTLNVQKLLEGSVQKSGERIRITAQLINTSDGFHVWSKTYDRDLVDIFAVQDEITAAVVMALRQSILGNSEISGVYKGNYDAYNAYLLGINYFKKRTQESYVLAIEQFKKAIAIDANMALAWAGLSETYSDQTGFGTNFAPGFARAREAALKAIELDPKLPEAHLALASVQHSFDWDWEGMETSLLRAYALRPGDADIMRKLADLKLLQGKYTEALSDIELALVKDPLNDRIQRSRATALMMFDRYSEVLPEAQAFAKKYPDRGIIHFSLSRTYYMLNKYEQSLKAAKKEKFKFLRLQMEAILYNKLNNKPQAKLKLKELIDTYGSDVSWQVAEVYAAWGDADKAFAALERGFEVRDPGLTYIQISNLFVPYRDDPRYADFLKKMGFK